MADKKTIKSSSTSKSEHKENKDGLDNWLKDLYETKISDDELLDLYNTFRYKGFNRRLIIDQLRKIAEIHGKNVVIELILLTAIRGPQQASKIKLKSFNGTPNDLGIQASGGKGLEILTCQRITAATADLAAFFLKRVKYPKRISSFSCPGWLQFPSAGSIKLPDHLRKQHVEFTAEFSTRIGGAFNQQIYDTMIENAYYNESLQLF
jgi:hypothetical protein